MRRLGKPDGTVVVADEKVAPEFQAPTDDPVERLLYAASVLHCLPVGMSDKPSTATGTVMRPATLTALRPGGRVLHRRHPADRPRLPPLLPARHLTNPPTTNPAVGRPERRRSHLTAVQTRLPLSLNRMSCGGWAPG